MKYNSVLFNKFLNTVHNNTNTNNKDRANIEIITEDNQSKILPILNSSLNNMAAIANNIPLANLMATTTRFTDEYEMKEELGK